jgi:hypothetical protein
MSKKKQHGGARAGAGRPKKYAHPSHPLSFVLEEKLLARLDKAAEAAGLTRSQAITEAVTKWLRNR